MLSMCILKSPSSTIFGNRVDRWVRRTAKSFKKLQCVYSAGGVLSNKDGWDWSRNCKYKMFK